MAGSLKGKDNGVYYRPPWGKQLWMENRIRGHLASFALLTVYPIKTPKMCDIVFIQTNKDWRRKRHATQLIDKLKLDFDVIGSSYEGSTDEGRNLLEKNGFKKEKGNLIWKRDKSLQT